jgi:hypothetical protein
MRRAGVTRCGTMSFVAAIGRGPRGLEPLPSSLDRRPARDYVGAHGHEALAYGLDVAGGERLRFSGPEVLVKASAETTGGDRRGDQPARHTAPRARARGRAVLHARGRARLRDRRQGVPPRSRRACVRPPGNPHAQRRVVPRTGRTLTMCSPAGFEGFFRELAEAESAGTIGPEAYARLGALRRHLVVARSTQREVSPPLRPRRAPRRGRSESDRSPRVSRR